VIADDYLRRVGFVLRDLPWKMRRDLISELRAHLSELPEGTDLRERLGAPEQYAAEMRSAAGLERRRGPIAFLRARRPRNLILTLLALIVLGLAIGAVKWVDSYQPLAWSGTEELPVGAVATDTGDGELAVFHDRRPFHFGVSIANRGRFAVRVLGVPEPSILPFSARLLMSEESYPAFSTSRARIHFRRFRPFDLQPGEARLLLLRGVYQTNPTLCGSGLRWGGTTPVPFPVRFSFLWKTTTVRIDEPLQLWIRIPHKGYRGPPLRSCR
jgi:hypothetical protein